jgi:hypothetical protein
MWRLSSLCKSCSIFPFLTIKLFGVQHIPPEKLPKSWSFGCHETGSLGHLDASREAAASKDLLSSNFSKIFD